MHPALIGMSTEGRDCKEINNFSGRDPTPISYPVSIVKHLWKRVGSEEADFPSPPSGQFLHQSMISG